MNNKTVEIEVTITKIPSFALTLPTHDWHKYSTSNIRIFLLPTDSILHRLRLEYGLIADLATEDDELYSFDAIQQLANDLSKEDAEFHSECRISIAEQTVNDEEFNLFYSQNAKVLNNIEA